MLAKGGGATWKKKVTCLVGCVMILFAVYRVHVPSSIRREIDLDTTRRIIESILADTLNEEKGSGCNIPRLDPFAPEVVKLDKKMPKIKCEGQDWVKCNISECKVVPEILAVTKDIECVYNDIIHESDTKYHLDSPTVVLGDDKYILTNSDHVKIMCTGRHGSSFLRSKWKGHATGFRTTVEMKAVPPGKEDSLNVLMFGFDSTSKNGFIRGMPQSYKYFTKNMKGTILNGYNVVGDGTPAALIPLFSGKTELELPDFRKNMGINNTFDVKELIFYKLKNLGYRTAYFEDSPSIGTFQYRFNGFSQQPTDHYLFSLLMERAKSDKCRWHINYDDHKYCFGDTPQFQLFMNITDQFLQLDGKKIIFTFVADITHDKNKISCADDAMLEWLQSIAKRRLLEDTLVIIMGDHGPRFGDILDTFQGKLESRLPLMGIRLPEALKRRRPSVQSALERNVNVITTPHDIHATLLDVLDLRHLGNSYRVEGADVPRAMTLLEPIPHNRSCSEAGIQPHWCSCLSWFNVSENQPVYRKAVEVFVNYINAYTEKFRSQCVLRTLVEIKWVLRQTANERLLKFTGARDFDGYLGNFDGEQLMFGSEDYQVKVVLAPGHAAYEATLKYIIKDDKFVINSGDISRINARREWLILIGREDSLNKENLRAKLRSLLPPF